MASRLGFCTNPGQRGPEKETILLTQSEDQVTGSLTTPAPMAVSGAVQSAGSLALQGRVMRFVPHGISYTMELSQYNATISADGTQLHGTSVMLVTSDALSGQVRIGYELTYNKTAGAVRSVH